HKEHNEEERAEDQALEGARAHPERGHALDEQRRRQELHQRIAPADRCPAAPAASPEEREAQERDIVVPANRGLTVGAVRPRPHHRFTARQPVDAHIDKTPNDEPHCERDDPHGRTGQLRRPTTRRTAIVVLLRRRADRGRLVPPVECLPLDQEERRVLDGRKGRTRVLVQELGVLVADHVVVRRVELLLGRAGRTGGPGRRARLAGGTAGTRRGGGARRPGGGIRRCGGGGRGRGLAGRRRRRGGGDPAAALGLRASTIRDALLLGQDGQLLRRPPAFLV